MDGQGVPDAPDVAASAVAQAPAGAVNLRARADRPPPGDAALAARLQQKEFLRAQPKRRGKVERKPVVSRKTGTAAGQREESRLGAAAASADRRATAATAPAADLVGPAAAAGCPPGARVAVLYKMEVGDDRWYSATVLKAPWPPEHHNCHWRRVRFDGFGATLRGRFCHISRQT